jgi:hypothetical protein
VKLLILREKCDQRNEQTTKKYIKRKTRAATRVKHTTNNPESLVVVCQKYEISFCELFLFMPAVKYYCNL